MGERLGLRFSCLFRKRNPEIFNVRKRYSCGMTSFSTIAKVREHIVSQHRREASPGISCQCCKAVFTTLNDLDIHNRALPSERCIHKELDPLDGISSDIFSELTGHKRSYGRDNREQWSELWKLVFPRDNDYDVGLPDYHAVMEHFELRDQYLSSLPHLFLSLDNADEHLETKIRSHFLQVCKELECKAKDMDYVNDQSRRREKTRHQSPQPHSLGSRLPLNPGLEGWGHCLRGFMSPQQRWASKSPDRQTTTPTRRR
ncbi:hypothetical protein QBC33DRAFT_590988 [Phialemonium atrogriseum]|uniref:C2H2-type domain-containing protein n=1 Tax=Phialemonium atrogriseum TaxID=1093897 RepID=A0AAJ0FED0_9PEZI|nr:uncharacterized protein QBC33DRAFT_590988 [Phialemonium atrogriseum]KAK1765461.1 hypothetical protein QBC33DRAFT_590988 [Phialemonium atrogriseum]